MLNNLAQSNFCWRQHFLMTSSNFTDNKNFWFSDTKMVWSLDNVVLQHKCSFIAAKAFPDKFPSNWYITSLYLKKIFFLMITTCWQIFPYDNTCHYFEKIFLGKYSQINFTKSHQILCHFDNPCRHGKRKFNRGELNQPPPPPPPPVGIGLNAFPDTLL